LLQDVNGLVLETIILDLLARRRGTSLSEVAAILFSEKDLVVG